MSQKRIVVGDGGGFIGGHLVGSLLSQGHRVRCSDINPTENWYQVNGDAENVMADLSWIEHAQAACEGMNEVYQLTADMGGMGFIENNKALCMLTVLTSTHKLDAPKGVNGRNSNNTMIMDRLCWPLPSSCETVWNVPIAGSMMNTWPSMTSSPHFD